MNQTKKAEIKQRIPLYPSINSIYADTSEDIRFYTFRNLLIWVVSIFKKCGEKVWWKMWWANNFEVYTQTHE